MRLIKKKKNLHEVCTNKSNGRLMRLVCCSDFSIARTI